MANGQVEIHDPLSNHTEPRSTSDQDSMEDSVEFRLLMAYAKRRRPKTTSPTQVGPRVRRAGGTDGGTDPILPSSPETTDKQKSRKRSWKLPSIFSCMRPRRRVARPMSDADDRSAAFNGAAEKDEEGLGAEKDEDGLSDVAVRLTELADEIQFRPPELEEDSPQEDVNVEKMIGLLLRDAGDRLNEKELKDAAIATELFCNYSFFRRLMTTLLRRIGLGDPDPDSPGPTASPKTQIAVTCEVASRLTVVDTLPANVLLGHAATFLHTYYASWIQQQGGYEEAFHSEDEDDVQ